MRTIAILPVKSFGSAKQRLGGLLGGGARKALARAMFSDVLGSLRKVQELDAVVVVTGDRIAEAAALAERVAVLRDTRETGQSDAALIGLEYALLEGFDRALLVPGDTPLLDPAELSALLSEPAPEVVIAPDRHGTGTNALLLAPPDAIAPRFGPDSRDRHEAAAEDAGVSFEVRELTSLGLDVDTPADLAELGEVLDRRRGLAPMTRGALMQLDRSQARGPAAAARA